MRSSILFVRGPASKGYVHTQTALRGRLRKRIIDHLVRLRSPRFGETSSFYTQECHSHVSARANPGSLTPRTSPAVFSAGIWTLPNESAHGMLYCVYVEFGHAWPLVVKFDVRQGRRPESLMRLAVGRKLEHDPGQAGGPFGLPANFLTTLAGKSEKVATSVTTVGTPAASRLRTRGRLPVGGGHPQIDPDIGDEHEIRERRRRLPAQETNAILNADTGRMRTDLASIRFLTDKQIERPGIAIRDQGEGVKCGFQQFVGVNKAETADDEGILRNPKVIPHLVTGRSGVLPSMGSHRDHDDLVGVGRRESATCWRHQGEWTTVMAEASSTRRFRYHPLRAQLRAMASQSSVQVGAALSMVLPSSGYQRASSSRR